MLVHCVVQCLLPFSALFSTPTFHTSSGLSQLRRAQLGVYLGESASLGDVHLVSISKLPPFVPLIKLTTFPAFIKFQYLYFPLAFLQLLAFILLQYFRCPSATSCIHFGSILYLVPPWPAKVPTCASQQLPAFMRFQYLSFPPSSLHSFLHAPKLWFNI